MYAKLHILYLITISYTFVNVVIFVFQLSPRKRKNNDRQRRSNVELPDESQELPDESHLSHDPPPEDPDFPRSPR